VTDRTEVSRRLDLSATSCQLRAWQRYWLIAWAVLWGAGVILVLLPFMNASWQTKALLVAVLAGGTYFFLESALSRIDFYERGLVVRNGWRHIKIDWPSFERFVIRRRWGQKSGCVELSDGKSVGCLVLSTSGLIGGGEDLEFAVDHLNEAAESLRH
jgi:hypothetical protein